MFERSGGAELTVSVAKWCFGDSGVFEVYNSTATISNPREQQGAVGWGNCCLACFVGKYDFRNLFLAKFSCKNYCSRTRTFLTFTVFNALVKKRENHGNSCLTDKLCETEKTDAVTLKITVLEGDKLWHYSVKVSKKYFVIV